MMPTSKTVVQIAGGYDHSAAVTLSGELYMWGKGDVGQIGTQAKALKNLLPVLIDSVWSKSEMKVPIEHCWTCRVSLPKARP